MDDFEVIQSVDLKVDHSANNTMPSNDKEIIPLSSRASSIINLVDIKQHTDYKHILNVSDISNHVVDGREVAVTIRSIERVYKLFCEVMHNKDVKITNINLAVVYACCVVDKEFLSTWQDKQGLVLIILRKYVNDNVAESEQPIIYMFIDSHVPVIVEKILHPKPKRFSFMIPKCCKLQNSF